MQEIFEAQKNNLIKLKTTSAKERITRLKKFKDAILEERSALQDAIYKDFKKNHTESDLTEILPTISNLNYTIKNLPDWMADVDVGGNPLLLGTSNWIRYEAKGNVLIISPWNYPVTLSLIPVTEAFAAGNSIILKPSEFTPSVNAIIKKIIEKSFAPNEVYIFEGDAKVSNELLSFPFNHIFFTGSTAVGKIVMEKAAKHLASITLELGGKSPCIIDEDVDLDNAVKKIIWGKFINAGQTCIAPDYCLVPKKLLSTFIEKSREVLEKFYPKETNDLAHIITNRHFVRLKNLHDDAVSKGAVIEIGGKFEGTDFIGPTLLTNVTKEMAIMDEEIFGPLLPIITYENSKEVVDLVESMSRPLALYVFSENDSKVNYYLNQLTSGGVCINDTILHITNHNMPFGGVNHSGIGSYHGLFGFKTFSHERAILKRNSNWGVDYFYPPYTPSKKNIVSKLFENLSRFI